ncbi:MAG: class I SAM-dependent methyltransferase [Paramuribaculum sp.]|nr:class I SAM-dependent methyltransferase [Paramuribaculum sp.]
MELDSETLDWIDLNAKANASALRLKYAGDSQKSFAILQIECRRKAATKLNETLACREFIFPTSLSAEQCTSDILAHFHASLVKGDSVLDMTAGLCIDAFNVAREVRHIIAIERNEILTEAAETNAEALGINNIEIINADSVGWLQATDRRFDTIFIDPARRGEGGKRIFALSDCEPDVVELLPLIRQKCSRLIVKASPMLDISSVISSLGSETTIYITGSPTECKEVVAVVDFGSSAIPSINAVTLSSTVDSRFSFTEQEEREAIPSYSYPMAAMYLYEPYPAAMKSGGFSLMSSRFGAYKLDKNTHLYISEKTIENFPGERFRILEVHPFSKQVVKSFTEKYPEINISTRNFILKPTELAKKLKIKEGGILRLFAVKALNELCLIITAPAAD